MKTPLYTTTRIVGLAVALAFGTQIATAAWVSAPGNPPANNVPAPVNATNRPQTKTGAVWFNNDGGGSVGLTVGQGTRLSSSVSGVSKLTIHETGDSSTNGLSGIELRKNGNRLGALFKKGNTTLLNNDIEIWNSSKPVITVKQNDITEFAGTITIKGGSPAANKVLTASDSEGSASWQNFNASGVSSGYTIGSSVTTVNNVDIIKGREQPLYTDPHNCNGKKGYWTASKGWYWTEWTGVYSPVAEYPCDWGYPANEFEYTQAQLQAMTCPAGYVLAGFNIHNLGQYYSRTGTLYCKQFIPN